ncbi:hypothetical protein, partial [Pelomicrobium sp. G1]|uniref:hypothetical protein n=1 Tax=Pelomicrobium sp. G1 TaxID=3452920 RepID=UPI003F76326E
ALDAEVRRLCAIDGGIRVYEQVKLPVEEFDKYTGVGLPAKRDANPDDEYYYEREIVYLRTSDPTITRTIHRIIRRSDGKVLGESIRYARGGGDIQGPWHPSSFICPEVSPVKPGLELSVFYKEETR